MLYEILLGQDPSIEKPGGVFPLTGFLMGVTATLQGYGKILVSTDLELGFPVGSSLKITIESYDRVENTQLDPYHTKDSYLLPLPGGMQGLPLLPEELKNGS